MSGKKVKFRVEGDTLRETFGQFVTAKKADGLSEHTIKTYTSQFQALAKWMDLDTPIAYLTDASFRKVFADMSDSELSRNSIRSYSAMLKSLFSWCRSEGISEVEIRLFKGEETVPEIYTEQELKALLKRPSRRTATFAEVRTWAIINLLVNNGIRASTVRAIKNEDVHLEDHVILLRHTKTRKTFAVPLSDQMVLVLREYMRIRGGEPADTLFCAVDGSPMSESCLRSAIREYNHSRGVDKTGIHAFRHTFARMYLVECGGNAFKLQKLLGHSTLAMTKHYVQLYDADLVKDFREHSPLEALTHKPPAKTKR